MDNLRSYFQLDPSIHFLNHGSFGACPSPVFDVYQEWQRRLEKQPVLFLGRQINDLLAQARAALADYLHADPDDLAYIPNATHGANIVAHSLALQPGDEILTGDQEYGACDYAWQFACLRTGAVYIKREMPLPVTSAEELADQFWQGVTRRTRVIYLSHITSPTAIRLPVEMICARARQAGILTVIDAAHSPGQLALDLQTLGADFVFGNCHKWMMAPKGAGFLYVQKEKQDLIQPLVVSWGYHATPASTTGSRFLDLMQWNGTCDFSAFLTVPSAIEFMRQRHWEEVRRECHLLLREALEGVTALTGLQPHYPLDSDLYAQMGAVPLPKLDVERLKSRLYDEFKVEVPITFIGERAFLRVSVQGYNDRRDIDALLEGLQTILPSAARK